MYVYIIIFKGAKLGDAGGALFLPYPKSWMQIASIS